MRDKVLQQIWEAQNTAYDLMTEYDSIPHRYGEEMLYQAEGQMVDLIAVHPGITATELSELLKKTVSACSQIIRKLREKDLVKQVRNPENNRLYNLTLTDSGAALYSVFDPHSLPNPRQRPRNRKISRSFHFPESRGVAPHRRSVRGSRCHRINGNLLY